MHEGSSLLESHHDGMRLQSGKMGKESSKNIFKIMQIPWLDLGNGTTKERPWNNIQADLGAGEYLTFKINFNLDGENKKPLRMFLI